MLASLMSECELRLQGEQSEKVARAIGKYWMLRCLKTIVFGFLVCGLLLDAFASSAEGKSR